MSEKGVRKRKKIVYTCPNPFFEQWLKEWRDDAVEKGWKTQYIYAKALRSLQKYPLPLSSGQEAKILENFGDKICGMLDEKLAQHERSRQLSPGSSSSTSSDALSSLSSLPEKRSKSEVSATKSIWGEPKPPKEYVPVPRSGAHALLLTLHNTEVNDLLMFMKKADLMASAQEHCDKSFTRPEPNSHYTAWSSMSTLIRKLLVTKVGSPARYSLTESGRNLAKKLVPENAYDDVLPFRPMQRTPPERSEPVIKLPSIFTDSSSADDYSEVVEDGFMLQAGTFDVILCVDNCETTPGIATNRKSSLLPELRKNGVPHDVRKLNVGDFLWVARERVRPAPGQLHLPQAVELVLDFIVERKRMDDLAHSIKDGRFHEQKFRLKSSGLRRPIYLVEDFGTGNLGLPESTLQQAIINTQVVDKFTVKKTKDQNESVAYLTLMTRYLQSMYANKSITSCSADMMMSPTCPANSFLVFQEFNSTAIKNKKLQVKEMFIKQLLQIHGLTLEKAVAITEFYPTPFRLMEAYEQCFSSNVTEKENYLSAVKYGKSKRNLGPMLSKVIYHSFGTKFS